DFGAPPLLLPRHRRSREPGLFADQEGRPWRSLPAHRQEHFRFTSGGSMTLLAAWSEIVADWDASFPQRRTVRRAVRQALGSLVCLAGAVCRASFGPKAASSAVGRASTFSTRVVAGNRRRCLRACGVAPCPIVPAAWWASPSTTPACARRAAPFPRRAIIAIPSRPPFMTT